MLIFDEHYSSVLTPEGLRTGRAKRRDDLWSVWLPRSLLSKGGIRMGQVRRVKLNRASALQLLENCFHLKNGNRCVLPTWWLSRGGCTRSLSEHGRETPQRQWYFVSRRGRVGRCQVCKTQHKIFSITKMGNKPKSKGRQKRPLCYNKSFRGVEQPGSSSGS